MNQRIRLDSEIRPELPASHYLDNRIYTDPDIYSREQKEIFGKQWKFVCHESELANVRDFRAVSVAGRELIIIKGGDGEIRAFYNSCPHRGSKILREHAGNLPSDRMTCFYHMWSFNTRGECLAVSRPDGYTARGVSRENINLRAVRMEILHGLIFVCLSDDTVSLKEFLGPELLKTIQTPWSGDLEVFHFHRQVIKANWKLFVETNCEGYHELLHPFNRSTGLAVKEYNDRQWHVLQHGHCYVDEAQIGYDRYGNKERLERQDDLLPGMAPSGHVVVDIFPDVMLNCRATVGRIDCLIPLGPDETLLEFRGFGLKGDTPALRERRIRHHNQVWGPMGVNLSEDLWAVEVQMENFLSGASRYSVIAREEDGPMSDAPLRGFYSHWRHLVQANSHDIDSPYNNELAP
jgi:phenylpropionate dioxygenase-like ring-hydroxylating dioxygenase large terminal subunit